MKSLKFLLQIATLVSCFFASAAEAADSFDYKTTKPFQRVWADSTWDKEYRQLPMQGGGRLKPFDTYCREGLKLLVGKEQFQGKPAIEVISSILFEPHEWEKIPFIKVSYGALKQELGLEAGSEFFTMNQLMHSPRLVPLINELEAKRKAEEKINPYFSAVEQVSNQLVFVQTLISGRALRLVPPTAAQMNEKGDTWLSFEEFPEEIKVRFALLAASFSSDKLDTQNKFAEYVGKFKDVARLNNPMLFPESGKLRVEVLFNQWKPFRWAWVLCLLGAILLSFSFYSERKLLYWAGMGAYIVALFTEIFGFSMRCWIAGRPPVSNMYESIIWVAFGSMAMGMILELIYRKKIIAIAALICGAICLIVADSVTGVIDDGIHPLEAVLRSNLWLTIHVLTIVMGYAAFALALIIGNFGVIQVLWRGKASEHMPMRLLSFYAYRAIQIGVVLLASGTILGGVWADYSWGRFWGWDPKETWALIALMGYLALLHARFRGMVGHFGFLAWSVVAFLGVLMAWYGVNFVLGAGKHSYGFSSGGLSYVATYVSVQLLVTFYSWILIRRQSE